MQGQPLSALRSPGTLVTLGGAALTVIGSVAYLGDNANLSLPTIFYGLPILLGGLALKSSELPPAPRLVPPDQLRELRSLEASEPLRKLLSDVSRWRYGQKAHLESSLEALKLWDEDNPPQLLAVEELQLPEGYGLRLEFAPNGVAAERWFALQDRLGRFFGKGLRAELDQPGPDRLNLRLLPSG
ncbi:MAG: DUF2854 domain-containing protein [Synechococcaceae cyanobacterium]|nr:DUF2854 domain-containing protein [Synechococcaceae cyanobacterium]